MIILVKLAVIALRILYLPYKLILRPKDKITMLSRQGDEIPISYELTKKALQEINPDVPVVVLAKKFEGSLLHKAGYCFHVLEQMYHIATSKIVVVDGFCIPVSVLNHKRDQIFLQMWHALNIIKKFAYLALDKPAGVKSDLAKTMCMHRNYTHILCGCKESGELLKKSFHAEDAELLITGLPYIDYIMNAQEETAQAMINTYPCVKEKETILYAPTFRRHRSVDIHWIEEKIYLDRYNVVVKLHPVDKRGIEGKFDSRIIWDESYSTHEWLWICDTVITDFSGISVEASLLKRKLYFYLYDKESYEKEVGLNIDLYEEPISVYVCETADQLAEKLKEEYDYSLVQPRRSRPGYLSVCATTQGPTPPSAALMRSIISLKIPATASLGRLSSL